MEMDNKQVKKTGTAWRTARAASAASQHGRQSPGQSRTRGVKRAPRRAVQPLPEPKKFLLPKYHAPARPQRIVRKRAGKFMIALRVASAVVAVFVLMGGFLVWKG